MILSYRLSLALSDCEYDIQLSHCIYSPIRHSITAETESFTLTHSASPTLLCSLQIISDLSQTYLIFYFSITLSSQRVSLQQCTRCLSLLWPSQINFLLLLICILPFNIFLSMLLKDAEYITDYPIKTLYYFPAVTQLLLKAEDSQSINAPLFLQQLRTSLPIFFPKY